MKKVFILLVGVIITALNTKADDGSAKVVKTAIESISDNTLKQFGSVFYRASDVSWAINKSFQKASFVLNGKTSSAIYDYDNQLLVATQNVTLDEIPRKAQQYIQSSYNNYKISKAVKVLTRPADYKFNDDTNHYWISLFGENKEVILLISPSSDITIVSTKTLGS